MKKKSVFTLTSIMGFIIATVLLSSGCSKTNTDPNATSSKGATEFFPNISM
ncbi:MAG: hypothetical protein H7061_02790 [Bdellovibrionaceae bacterium]|nr:hypothetical protein [Bdellovibrio sp.]